MGKLLSAKKDFVGRFMAARPALTDHERPTLVGLKPIDKDAGAHLVPKDAEPIARNDQGYVTSIAYSPSLGHWLGLGLIARGPERHGEVVRACDPLRGSDIEVEICHPGFIDPDGVRLRV